MSQGSPTGLVPACRAFFVQLNRPAPCNRCSGQEPKAVDQHPCELENRCLSEAPGHFP